MSGWLSQWFGGRESSTAAVVCGKALEVRCSAAAERALADRTSPLLVEMELAFACFARKEIRFYETPGEMPSGGNLVPVSDRLALMVTTVVPGSCEAKAGGENSPMASVRSFVPRWVRIDYARGRWVGEYGL